VILPSGSSVLPSSLSLPPILFFMLLLVQRVKSLALDLAQQFSLPRCRVSLIDFAIHSSGFGFTLSPAPHDDPFFCFPAQSSRCLQLKFDSRVKIWFSLLCVIPVLTGAASIILELLV
jgi:hypothetical protein